MSARKIAIVRPIRTRSGSKLRLPWPSVLCLGLAVAVVSACGNDRDGSGKSIVYLAPIQSRAMWVLEPASIGIGDVATLEVAVVTRPNRRVLPFATPDEVVGLWILEVETLPIDREPNRWIHRTRVRVRPREVGQFDWPSTPIEVEGDGVVETLTADGITVEVLSVIPNHVGKLTPFGLQPQPLESTRGQPWMWSVGGAGFTLGCLGLVWLARRESKRPQTDTRSHPTAVPPWKTALESLEASLNQVDRDAISACESASVALRCYIDRRYNQAAATHTIGSLASTITRTTEELQRATPPFAATSRWPQFVSLLSRLDQFQFPAPTDGDSAQAGAREIIRDVASFVRDTIPNEVAR